MGPAQRDARVSREARLQAIAAGRCRRDARAPAGRNRARVRSRRAAEARQSHLQPGFSGGCRLMRARVFVTLKPSVFDPQGKTVTDALHTLGYAAVKDVRQGKYFELSIDADCPDAARALAEEAAEKLLSNPVIESYRIELADEALA